MKNNNEILLLQGRTLLQVVKSETDAYKAWAELSLQDDLKPEYPFRTEPNSMIGHSPYFGIIDESDAKFKFRISCFLVEDLESGFEPSYDKVGEYIKFDSLDELFNFLDANGLSLDKFIDASCVDDYPL